MVTPTPDIQYVYNASITWNWARQVIKSNTDISDFPFSSADEKAIIKNHILMSQKMGNSCEWNKYRDKLVLFWFWFLWNLSKSLKITNIICWYYSTKVELHDHPSIRIPKLLMVKYFLNNHSWTLLSHLASLFIKVEVFFNHRSIVYNFLSSTRKICMNVTFMGLVQA